MQKIRFSKYFKLFFILIDIVVITSVLIYFFIRNNNFQNKAEVLDENSPLFIILIFIWLLLGGRTKLYSIPRNLTYTLYLERLVTHIVIFLLCVIIIAKISNNEYLKSDRFIIAGGLFIGLFFVKSTSFFFLKYIRTLGVNHRNVMFFSNDDATDILKDILKRRKDYGYKVFESADVERKDVRKIVEFWKTNGIHTIFLSAEQNETEDCFMKSIFEEAETNKVKIALLPNIVQNTFSQYDMGYIDTQPILSPAKYPLDYLTNYIIKRGFDIIFSLVVLLGICSWLFPIIALLIRMDSKGPIFFLQKRYGFHNEVFKCIKFRTMKVNSESFTKTTLPNDNRITKLGKFLRKTSLDEMPQFLNVLRGEMSIVGPRPHMLLVDDYFKLKINRYALRGFVKPGITGLAQVNGLRGDNGDMEIEMKKRILADTFYVRNWSFVLDMVIILKTVLLVVRGDKNAI